MNDPRVFFAAERTLLAWIRTGITVMILGFVVERFGLFLALFAAQAGQQRGAGLAVSTVIGAGLAIVGAGVIAVSAVQHRRYTRTLPLADLPPGYRIDFAPRCAFVVAALGAILAAYLALP